MIDRMVSTDDLINSLSRELTPVHRLRPPMVRAVSWIALAVAVIVVLTLWRGVRADMNARIHDPAYWVQVVGALLTGVCATLAVFEISLPDRPGRWAILPVPAAIMWATGFAYGCLGHWIALAAGAPIVEESVRCVTTIVLATIPLGLVLWLMYVKPVRCDHPVPPGSAPLPWPASPIRPISSPCGAGNVGRSGD